MSEAIVITPVKDSLETTKKTIEAISKAKGDFEYFVFNDFSKPETKSYLEKIRTKLGFELIHLEDVTSTPSPNYKLVLQMAQKKALENNSPLIIVESDVVIQKNTLDDLIKLSGKHEKTGLFGAITVDQSGKYNFPYTFEKKKSNHIVDTSHSLSFCCTLISTPLLERFDFQNLSQNKDWFDVFISRQSKKLGFKNYLAKGLEVLHLPHSSRPWKNLKYTNPVLYYLKKIINKRDRI
ncbi:glycosyltransferase [Maribellus maritimus]|uniref:glycosyltransferase n=1 Tax=Maribellus maritimus TaxID=2870838 RepID=UPI001EEA8829|nr:glycosyltransferase [Maribellus maritimus]MCG6185840.1 glycosyltransferase [Maribellus maritimus]